MIVRTEKIAAIVAALVKNAFVVTDDHTGSARPLAGAIIAKPEKGEAFIVQVIAGHTQCFNDIYLDKSGRPHLSMMQNILPVVRVGNLDELRAKIMAEVADRQFARVEDVEVIKATVAVPPDAVQASQVA